MTSCSQFGSTPYCCTVGEEEDSATWGGWAVGAAGLAVAGMDIAGVPCAEHTLASSVARDFMLRQLHFCSSSVLVKMSLC